MITFFGGPNMAENQPTFPQLKGLDGRQSPPFGKGQMHPPRPVAARGGVPDGSQDHLSGGAGRSGSSCGAQATTAGPSCRRPVPRRGTRHQFVGTRAGRAARGRPGVCEREVGHHPATRAQHRPYWESRLHAALTGRQRHFRRLTRGALRSGPQIGCARLGGAATAERGIAATNAHRVASP